MNLKGGLFSDPLPLMKSIEAIRMIESNQEYAMQIYLSLLRRKPLFLAISILLLLLAVALTTIGVSMRFGIAQQTASISDSYTTIAVPAEEKNLMDVRNELRKKHGNDYPEEKIEEEVNAYSLSVNPVLAHKAAMESGYVEAVDHRYLMGAYVEGSKALTSCAADPMQYQPLYDWMSYDMAVFALQCNAAADTPDLWQDEFGHSYITYEADMTILDVVSLADGYPSIDDPSDIVLEAGPVSDKQPISELRSIRVYSELYAPDGSIPFQAGHTYLVCGHYRDFVIANVLSYDPAANRYSELRGRAADFGRELHPGYYHLYFAPYGQTYTLNEASFDAGYRRSRSRRGSGETYFYPADDALPYYAEYEGSWQDFLASEQGRVWREQILPLCEINQSSATVLLSDNVQSMYCFHSGQAGLLEGRFFTANECTEGKAVCMVSAAYALYNGYQIGDKLTLDLYDTGFSTNGTSVYGQEYDAITRGACLPDRRIGVTKEYEIVGIYSAPEISAGSHVFRADTILLPKESVPGSEQYEVFNEQLLYSLILKNGTQEAFQAYMEQAVHGDAFLYFDQGYSALEISLDTLTENGLRMLYIGLAVLAVTAILVSFLAARRFAPTAQSMRLLGIGKSTVFKQSFGALLLMDAVSVALGTGTAVLLCKKIAETAYSDSLWINPLVVAGCAAALLVLLLIPSLLCAKRLSSMPLMQSGGKRK